MPQQGVEMEGNLRSGRDLGELDLGDQAWHQVPLPAKP